MANANTSIDLTATIFLLGVYCNKNLDPFLRRAAMTHAPEIIEAILVNGSEARIIIQEILKKTRENLEVTSNL